MTVQSFKALLLTVGCDVFHFESHKKSEYIVWHETGGMKLSGDNATAESGTIIAVDYFTKEEYPEIPERIAAVLGNCDEISLSDRTVIYEEDTRLTHYAWTCEVI